MRLAIALSSFMLVSCASAPVTAPPSLFKSIAKPEFQALTAERDAKKQTYMVSLAAKGGTEDVAQKGVDAAKAEIALTDAQNLALEARLIDVLHDCNQALSTLGAKAERQELYSFWLSMSGLVAGSVLAPAAVAANAAAHRAFISAASGWAGATNLASQTLRTTGLAGDATATARNAIVSSLNAAIERATDTSKSFDERFAGIQKARAACISFAITIPGAIPTAPTPASEKRDEVLTK